jgi:hypothetical protein
MNPGPGCTGRRRRRGRASWSWHSGPAGRPGEISMGRLRGNVEHVGTTTWWLRRQAGWSS